MVLISVDVPESVKQRKETQGVTWGYLLMKGLQSIESHGDDRLERLEKGYDALKTKYYELRKSQIALQMIEVNEDA